ncbi:hypothetical protein P872_10210 [Rhodonellum psychrophilum GCM71 = DSM 17998]|uniref:Uncharacterized protein n=3 Tax=Cytophagaceae TaxID=89373 RepID=U5BVA8_9BACT|nr:hypothetical protein P872_10210 [Rhodonellum psychrophilum GCM71 = DSM 17998]
MNRIAIFKKYHIHAPSHFFMLKLQFGSIADPNMSKEPHISFHHNIPLEIREVTLKALSHYPKLKEVGIEFLFNENIRKSVMQAQPKFTSMLGAKENRTYVIKVSRNFSLKGKSTPIQDLPEAVLIGWIGHELGHIMDYLNKSNLAMVYFGIGYLSSKRFVISAERDADTYAVNHGLGDYILATKDFILHQAGMSEKYIQKIKRLYLSPEVIMELMENKISEEEI